MTERWCGQVKPNGSKWDTNAEGKTIHYRVYPGFNTVISCQVLLLPNALEIGSGPWWDLILTWAYFSYLCSMQNTSLHQRARPNCEVPEFAIPDAEKPHTLDTRSARFVSINSHDVTMDHRLRACHCLPLHLWSSLHVLGSLLSLLEIEDKCTLGITWKLFAEDNTSHLSNRISSIWSRHVTELLLLCLCLESPPMLRIQCCKMLQTCLIIIIYTYLYYLSFTTMQPRLFLAVVP